MSYDEKENRNKWRVSREVTAGDLIIIVGFLLPALIAVLNERWTVADHEKRITATEAAITVQTSELAQHDTAIAVLRVKISEGQNKQPKE